MTKQKHLFGFRRSALAVAVALSLGAGNAFAVPTLNEFSNSSGTNDPNFLADHLIKSGAGIIRTSDALFQGNLDEAGDGGEEGYGGYGGEVATEEGGIVGPSVVGSNGSASYFENLNLDEDGSLSGDFSLTGKGILLTSGVGTPPTSNTQESFTGFASQQGDAGLDAVLAAAGLGGQQTFDATVLAFDFELDGAYNAVSLEFMFGSEEYPEYPDFNDVAAIFIDGRNVSVFSDGSGLIISNGSIASSNFVDNADTGGGSPLDIEYDGISEALKIIVPLSAGEHSIKIAVSDSGDSIVDTGLFVADFQGVMLDAGVDPGDPVLPDPGDDPSDGFDMTITVGDSGIGIDPTTPIWIDPPVAIGYIIEVTGAEKFATATMPSGFGDDKYDIFWDDAGTWVPLGEFNASDLIDFLTLADPSGVAKFKIEGIEASAGVDPNDPLGFPVGVTFTGAGTFNVNMSPITNSVPATAPEPATFALLGAGLAGMGALRRRRKVK